MVRIRAFTLFEMVLAMLLAAIVIGMAYSAYTIILSMYKSHNIYVERNTKIATFRKLVYADFDGATDIALNGSRIVFKDVNHKPVTSYEINRDSIIRISTTIDTFYLKDLVVAAEFENNNTIQGRIDHLTFNFQHAGIPVKLGISKIYSSEEFFETKSD